MWNIIIDIINILNDIINDNNNILLLLLLIIISTISGRRKRPLAQAPRCPLAGNSRNNAK